MKTGEHTASLTGQGMPTHQHLVVSILKAVDNLGGSANTNEIAESVIENRPNAEEIRQSTYPPHHPALSLAYQCHRTARKKPQYCYPCSVRR